MSIVKLHKAYRPAPDIGKADKSAAGTMPAGAFQYCEAMRTASSYGWYVYPPKDLSLVFDGREAFFFEDDQWYPVKSVNFEEEFRRYWQRSAPADLAEFDPPFLSELFVPGILQIWSGYFIETAEDWSVLIRPPVNYDARSSFSYFEGIVETDQFKPCPLFINIRLLATDREIFIPKDRPLFQIQPLLRASYAAADQQSLVLAPLDADDPPFDWQGARRALRKVEDRHGRRPGTYASSRRKRSE